MVGRADAGQQEQLRAVHRAAGQQDLPLRPGRGLRSAAAVVDDRGAAAFGRDPGDQRVGLHGEVRPGHRGPQVRVRGRAAAAAALGDLVEADPVLRRAVEVVVGGQAAGPGRFDERLGQRRLVLCVLHPQRAAGAVIGRGAARVVLGPDEIGEQVGVAPPGAAVFVPPGVVVVPVAPDVDHRVERGGAAEGLAAGPVDAAAGRLALRDRGVIPVVRALPQQAESGGDVDLVRVVGRSRLEEQHPQGWIFGQPGRQDAPSTPGPDNDVVVHECLPDPVRTHPTQDFAAGEEPAVCGAGGAGRFLVRKMAAALPAAEPGARLPLC